LWVGRLARASCRAECNYILGCSTNVSLWFEFRKIFDNNNNNTVFRRTYAHSSSVVLQAFMEKHRVLVNCMLDLEIYCPMHASSCGAVVYGLNRFQSSESVARTLLAVSTSS